MYVSVKSLEQANKIQLLNDIIIQQMTSFWWENSSTNISLINEILGCHVFEISLII